MIEYLWYTLKVSICLAVFYLFFIAVLRQSTFFVLNRVYLLTGLLLSFIIPVLKFSIFTVQSTSVFSKNEGVRIIEPEYAFFQPLNLSNGASTINLHMILSVIYFFGASVLLLKLLLSIIKIIRTKGNTEVCRIGALRIIKTKSPIPFSFFNTIFLPMNESNPMIVEHEMAHIAQAHWFDLILVEITSVLLWFNPFVTLYKSSLRLQHEYLADLSVIKSNVQLESYLNCMLTQVKIVSSGGLTSQFYCKTIKKRIIMITKNKTSFKYFGVYLLALPLVCMLLFAFTSGTYNTPLIPSKTILADTDEYQPSIYPVSAKKVTQINGYGERVNPITKQKDFHYAIDFAALAGEEIMSTAKGVIVEAAFDSQKGNYVLIKHNDMYTTFYSHLKSISVKVGESVKKGQTIGYVGSTGVSTGSHVHYEVHKNGERVNPSDYLPK